MFIYVALGWSGAKEIYEEEIAKDPCRKHLMQNMCPFGDNCKFSHYHPADLERLRLSGKFRNFLSA